MRWVAPAPARAVKELPEPSKARRGEGNGEEDTDGAEQFWAGPNVLGKIHMNHIEGLDTNTITSLTFGEFNVVLRQIR